MILHAALLPVFYSRAAEFSCVAIIGQKYSPSDSQRLDWVRIDAYGTVSLIRKIEVPANSSADLSPDGSMVLTSSGSDGLARLLLHGPSGLPDSATLGRITGETLHTEFSPNSRFILVSWALSTETRAFHVYSRSLKPIGKAVASAGSRHSWTRDGRLALSGEVFKTEGTGFARAPSSSISSKHKPGIYPNQDGSITYSATENLFSTRSAKRIPFRPYSGVSHLLWADKYTFVFSGSDYSGVLKPRHYSVLQQIRWNPESESFGPAEVLYRGGSGFPEGDPSLTFPSTPIGVLDDGVVVVDTRQDGDKIVWLKDRLPYTLCRLPAGDRGFRAVQLIGTKK